MTVLSVVGIVSKVIGALHRIPLAWLIGDTGMGVYQLIFPTYNMLLAISSAGLPVAISRMVSYSLARDDPRNAKRTFRIALCFLSALGLIAMLLMILFSPQLAVRSKNPATQSGFVTIAPALLLVCSMSALRGFMQGQQNMVPTAISQFIEQVAKVLIALPLAYWGSKVSISYAVAGVLLGTSVAEALALLYMICIYLRNRREFRELPQNEELPVSSVKSTLWRLVAFSIPVTIGACIVPIYRQRSSAGTADSGRDRSGRSDGAVRPLFRLCADADQRTVCRSRRNLHEPCADDLRRHRPGRRQLYAPSERLGASAGLCGGNAMHRSYGRIE